MTEKSTRLNWLQNYVLLHRIFSFCVVFVCVSGQSVHLGMGGSWSCAVPRHLWTLCHILPGLLYLLLHWRVSINNTKLYKISTYSISLLFHVNHRTVQETEFSFFNCYLNLTSVFQGLCGHSALWKDQLRETPGKV